MFPVHRAPIMPNWGKINSVELKEGAKQLIPKKGRQNRCTEKLNITCFYCVMLSCVCCLQYGVSLSSMWTSSVENIPTIFP